MGTANTENTRAGKYCPRCQTMTVLAQDICAQCGHRFRTGYAGQAPDAPRTDADTLNRTRQFTLPPLVPRPAPTDEPPVPLPPAPLARRLGPFVATVLLLFAVLATVAYLRQKEAARAVKLSPVGAWETTLTSRSAQNARLGFIFREDGGGVFSWATPSAPARQGQTPMQWRIDAAGQLVLILSPPAESDTVSGTLITIFGSHPWLWHRDPAQHRLIIGTLTFQQK